MRALVERAVAGWALLGGLILLAIVLVTTTNVAAFGLDKLARLSNGSVPGLPGYEDFVRLAISAAALMFFPYCQLRNGHVAVDLFVNALPAPVRAGLDRLSLVLTAALALFLGWWMVLGLMASRSDQVQSSVLGWPEWPFYLPGVVSLLLWAIVALMQVGEALGSGGNIDTSASSKASGKARGMVGPDV